MFILVELEKSMFKVHSGLENPIERIRSIANFQYGAGVGQALFPENVQIEYSHSTGRIRYISLKGMRIATLRPTDGLLSLSVDAARKLAKACPEAPCFVTVKQDVAEFVARGGDVFAAHVAKVNDEVHAKDEVVVLGEAGQVLAVGRAFLSALEMRAFKTGVAVKVRHGERS